jgi:HPt (histidine-containing phosphotransfer) domain-containing protein
MNDHVGKPFKREQLYAVVQRWAMQRSEGAVVGTETDSSQVLDEMVFNNLQEMLGSAALMKLLGQMADQLRAFAQCDVAPADLSSTAKEAHKLVSAAGMLGFSDLSEVCRELEEACHAGLATELLLERLKRDRSAALMKLDAILAA